MPEFHSIDVLKRLGFTPICLLSDQEIWKHLFTPIVKALLGPITQIGPSELFDTVNGHFPGDEASNLNDHRLYGGKPGYVRYPYLSACHRTANGAIVIKRDWRKVRVSAWIGDVMAGKAELIHFVGLRDRHYDGTAQANDSPLLSFPYDNPIHSRTLPGNPRSAEVSVYSFSPDSHVMSVTAEPQYANFIESPFAFASTPDIFLKHFERVWKTKRSPGQVGAPIRDVSKLLLPGIERVAKARGYDFLEAACSHYHVAMWFLANKYRYTYQQDAETLDRLAAGMKQIRDSGTPLTRQQQSWVCVLQNLQPAELIPAHLLIPGARWPQDNIAPENLWVNKPLTEQALKLVPDPLLNKITAPTV
ncbi:MAG: hypothetical protein K2W82_10990 [Candidatus Obscuribacterales bacterium]|nr:hypothetical protein [Candidatus Obscuribacterales bacterium]